jgi:hypothetical protein
VFKATGITPDSFGAASHSLASTIASPDFFAGFVAFCAGIAGMLSLTTAKSGALIGVLISVTTIPAASNVGVAAAYQDWESFRPLPCSAPRTPAAGQATSAVAPGEAYPRPGCAEHARGGAAPAPTGERKPAAAAGGVAATAASGVAGDRAAGPYTDVPSDDQASSFARTRDTTSSVTSVVDAWPPRSGVRTPAALASRTAS